MPDKQANCVSPGGLTQKMAREFDSYTCLEDIHIGADLHAKVGVQQIFDLLSPLLTRTGV